MGAISTMPSCGAIMTCKPLWWLTVNSWWEMPILCPLCWTENMQPYIKTKCSIPDQSNLFCALLWCIENTQPNKCTEGWVFDGIWLFYALWWCIQKTYNLGRGTKHWIPEFFIDTVFSAPSCGAQKNVQPYLGTKGWILDGSSLVHRELTPSKGTKGCITGGRCLCCTLLWWTNEMQPPCGD